MTELIKFGKENTIAVRVYDNFGDGGIMGKELYVHVPKKENYPYFNAKPPFNPYKLTRW